MGDGSMQPSDLGSKIGDAMYDVIYIDAHGTESPVARHLADRTAAVAVARQAAAERGAGRMVLAGSTHPTNCVCVVHADLPEAA
jgi:hypothetical protein